MPARNIVKKFEADSMYHVYNRGNDKRVIFHDERDYSVFLSYLKYGLLSDEDVKASDVVDENLLSNANEFNLRRLGLKGKLELVAFCLMPNHFHLLFFQNDQDAITKMMRSVSTGYSMYYNKRYNRSGSLFQGVYKASKISNEGYWLHISRYIHLNPVDLGEDYKTYPQSSYRNFIGGADADWVLSERGMNGMDSKVYARFVEEWLPYRKDLKDMSQLLANSKELVN